MGRTGGVAGKAVAVEGSTVLRLLDADRISNEVLRTLEYELDLTESRAELRVRFLGVE
jgi:hypothetical protein